MDHEFASGRVEGRVSEGIDGGSQHVIGSRRERRNDRALRQRPGAVAVVDCRVIGSGDANRYGSDGSLTVPLSTGLASPVVKAFTPTVNETE